MITEFKIFETNSENLQIYEPKNEVKTIFFNYQGYKYIVYQYKGINFEQERNGSFFLQPLDCDGNLDKEKTLKMWKLKFHRLTASNALDDAKFLGYSMKNAISTIDELLIEIESNKYNL